MLDDDDRLIMDRSPDDLGSQDNDLDDELDSDLDEDLEGTTTSDGERIIYPWMKKIHVAGIGEHRKGSFYSDAILRVRNFFPRMLLLLLHHRHPFSLSLSLLLLLREREAHCEKKISISSESCCRFFFSVVREQFLPSHFNRAPLVNIFRILDCQKSLQILLSSPLSHCHFQKSHVVLCPRLWTD
jgi:hypothetical protein